MVLTGPFGGLQVCLGRGVHAAEARAAVNCELDSSFHTQRVPVFGTHWRQGEFAAMQCSVHSTTALYAYVHCSVQAPTIGISIR